MKKDDIIQVEDMVMRCTGELSAFTAQFKQVDQENTRHRNYYGTLHINLSTLIRRAGELKELLEKEYGFK